ncbi:MAG: FAD-dependent oxidoreductase [Actinomycetota bacterium]
MLTFGEGETLEVDAVIVSVGRRPFPDQLNLGATKVKVSERGFVEVDEWCRTSARTCGPSVTSSTLLSSHTSRTPRRSSL